MRRCLHWQRFHLVHVPNADFSPGLSKQTGSHGPFRVDCYSVWCIYFIYWRKRRLRLLPAFIPLHIPNTSDFYSLSSLVYSRL